MHSNEVSNALLSLSVDVVHGASEIKGSFKVFVPVDLNCHQSDYSWSERVRECVGFLRAISTMIVV